MSLVFLVIIALLAFVAFYFRSYINAYMIASNKSAEEMQQMLDEQKPEKLLENYADINIRDLTDEEQKKLANNELSEEEAIDLIVGKIEIPVTPSVEQPDEQAQTLSQSNPEGGNQPAENKTPSENAEQNTPDTQTPENNTQQEENTALKEANEKIARLVAKLYVIKSQSNARLENLEAEWKAEFLSTPAKERKGEKSFSSFVKKGIKIVAGWEKETDAKVNEVLSEIETLLKESGQNLDLVSTLKKSYEDEKTYTKAYYMGKINENS